MTKPVVSIVVPCFNKEGFILQAVESCLAQTVGGIEVIVVDDGSTDSSVESLASVASRVKLVTGQNRGVCSARNRGVELAGGEWVHFLDADDALHPRAVELMLDASRLHPDCQVISSLHEDVSEGWRVGSAIELAKMIDVSASVRICSPLAVQYLPATSLIRRALLDEVGPWDESLRRWTDLEFQMRIAARVERVVAIDLPLYYYRHHSAGQISDSNVSLSGYESGAQALRAAEFAVRDGSLGQREREAYFAPFHLHLARTALACGDGSSARAHLAVTARYKRENKFALKAAAASLSTRIFGARRTGRWLEARLKRATGS